MAQKAEERAETCMKAIVKVPYYIEACFLRSPCFVTLAAFKARTSICAEWSFFANTVTYSCIIVQTDRVYTLEIL